MAELPIQIGQTVEVQQAPSVFSTAKFEPADFGGDIGKQVSRIGRELREQEEKDRKIKADFDAVNADHEFVKQEAAIWADYKEKTRPDKLKENLPQYIKSLEDLTPKIMKDMGLTDEYAQKAFYSMTRRRIDYRLANATLYAEDQYEKWQDNTAVSAVESAVTQAREMPPVVRPDGVVDTRDLGHNMQEAAHLRMERLGKHMPEDKAAAAVHGDQVRIVESALAGYLGAEDSAGMKKFLDAPIAGINDSQGIPLTPKRILGDKWKEWEKKADRILGEKKGDALGFSTLQEANWDPVAANDRLLASKSEGKITQEEYTSAVEAVKKHADIRKDFVSRQVATDERIIWDAYHANGSSTSGMLKTPEQRTAWERLQSTDFPDRLKQSSEKDAAKDMIVGAKWTEWLALHHDEASNMNLDQLLQVARSPEIGMTVQTEKYIVPSINRFLVEKNPLRKRGEAEVIQESRVDIFRGLGKEFDIARPELNRWENWDDPVERKAYAMYIQRATEWLGKWYADPANKGARPTPEEYQKAMGTYLEKIPVPAGDRSIFSFGEQTEPRIKQMARDLLRSGAGSGNTKAVPVGPGTAPPAPTPNPAPEPKAPASTPIPADELKEIDAALTEAGKPLTDANRMRLWKAMGNK